VTKTKTGDKRVNKDSYRCEKCGGVVATTGKVTIKQVKVVHEKTCPGRFR
jgi:hypothetical protein